MQHKLDNIVVFQTFRTVIIHSGYTAADTDFERVGFHLTQIARTVKLAAFRPLQNNRITTVGIADFKIIGFFAHNRHGSKSGTVK